MGHRRPFSLYALSHRIALFAIAVAWSPGPTAAQFVDRTASAGLARSGPSWGAIFVDLDGDGDLDLYSGHHVPVPTIYANDGSGHFDTYSLPQPWPPVLLDRHGAIIVSLDDDEDPDVFIAHGAAGGSGSEANEVFRNDGASGFASVAADAGLEDPDGRSRAASAADYDGDHRVDLWVGKAPRDGSPNSVFHNDGSLSFTDVAASIGLAEPHGTVGGIWGDVDDDGDVDLLVGGEEFPRPTVLYRNDAGIFTDVSFQFAPALPTISGADFGDMDDDGDLDLAVCDGSLGLFDVYTEADTVSFFFNTRYADDGVDGLTIPSTADTLRARLRVRAFDDSSLVFLGPNEVNPPSSLPLLLTDDYVGPPRFDPGVDRGIWIWRSSPGGPWELRCSTPLLNTDTFDGWLTDGSPITGVTAHDLEDPGFVPGGPRVWRNDGTQFAEITSELGLPVMVNPRDISWIDYDNDGDLDLHVVDMGTSAAPNAPDALFRNDGTVFSDVTQAEGIAGGTEGLGDGGTWGDADGDGDLDLFLQQGAGPLPFSELAPALYLENAGSRGNAIAADLRGRQSGPVAVGARLTAYVGGDVVRRRIFANAWRGFADPLAIHVGLGAASVADSITIEWPAGTVDTYSSVVPGAYRFNEGRRPKKLKILTASPDSVGPTQTGSLDFELLAGNGARLTGEWPNFALASVGGLLVPGGPASENPDSTYTIPYASQAALGADTLVVTDLLSSPPLTDSLEVRVSVFPDTIRVTADGPPRVHWNDALQVRVSILDPNGNRLLDEGEPFSIRSLDELGVLSPAQVQPDSSYLLTFAAASGLGIDIDVLVASDSEVVSVPEDSLSVEITDHAIVDSILDEEDDQGGQVVLTWQRDLRDSAGAEPRVTQYVFWRRGDETKGTWEMVGPAVPATMQPGYQAVVPTASDSSSFMGIPWTVFYVSAETTLPGIFFDSAPDSGYSVDNLPPEPPGPVVFVTPDRIEWTAPPDSDRFQFAVYESDEPEFDSGTATLLAFTVATGWEPVTAPFAYVTALDLVGNESEASGAANPTPAPEGDTAVTLRNFLGGGRPNPFRDSSRLDFALREGGVASLVVYDVRGRRVRILRQGFTPAGRYSESWNGVDSRGRPVTPGVYFVRLESGTYRATRKVVRIR